MNDIKYDLSGAQPAPQTPPAPEQKFCKHCGNRIDRACVVCPVCGKQVEELKQEPAAQPNIVINNSNTNVNSNVNSVGAGRGKMKSKWTALILCILGGEIGLHKFYEGKIGMGLLYLCTFGLCGIGWIVDIIRLIGKPDPYMP